MVCKRFSVFYKGDCLPLLSPLDVQLDPEDEHTMVQPDVLVVCDQDKVKKEKIVGAPDLVIEVVSPSNWHMDVTIKMKKYEACGVREYWIVLPDHKKVIVHHFEKKKEKMEYTFEDTIPVGIWDGRCRIDFKEIRDRIDFLLVE